MPANFPKQCFINNQWVDSVAMETFPTINPAFDQEICKVSRGKSADIDLAVKAAKHAFEKSEWSHWSPSQRRQLLLKIADNLEANKEEMAIIESTDNGKPFHFALSDVSDSANILRYLAGLTERTKGQRFSSPGNLVAYSKLHPVGVCGQIIPWNFPILMAVWKLAPVLASGCTTVIKPAENTPLSTLRFGQVCLEAGMPAGVINIVPGFGHEAGQALVEHPDVAKIAFTGSIPTAKTIQRTAAETLKRVHLELGGKSPNIVMDDADLDAVLPYCAIGCFINSGQICISGARVYVQEGIHDKFVQRVLEFTKRLKVDHAFSEGAMQGPLISKVQMDKVLKYIETGKREGAKLVLGGNRIDRKGFYVEPTIFTDVTDDMVIAREEIFGPVMSILKFKTVEEVIRRANDSNYGLAAGVQTSNLNTALAISENLKAGQVYVNTYAAIQPTFPFGGHKNSGIGRELGENCLDAYMEHSSIIINRH